MGPLDEKSPPFFFFSSQVFLPLKKNKLLLLFSKLPDKKQRQKLKVQERKTTLPCLPMSGYVYK